MMVCFGRVLVGGFLAKVLFAIKTCVLVLLLAAVSVGAEATPTPPVTYADVLFVSAQEQEDGTWRFDVTVRHADTGWEHYADAWEVVGPEGSPVATRVLAHPHVEEQPFTRSLSGIEIPLEYEYVLVRAHDLVHGSGGREVVVSLDAPSGPGFEVQRISRAPQELVAYLVDQPPDIDGLVEPMWESVPAVAVPLTPEGQDTQQPLVVTVHAAYDSERLYLLARWPEAQPATTAGAANKLTIHWSVVPDFIHCSAACHTAYVDAQRRVQNLQAETIPQGGDEPLPAAGGWENGEWIVEWSRPLRSGNPYDLQMVDLHLDYPFQVKVFEHKMNQPDPMSGVLLLRFAPAREGS